MQHFYENLEGWFDFQKVYTLAIQKSPNNSHFVEVGSWKGKSAAYMAVEIINSQKSIKFDCVDTWEGTPGEHEGQDAIINNTLFDEFKSNIQSVSHIVNPIKKTSVSAAVDYPDNSLDFVFIDANHQYEPVLNDLAAWYPKVKRGGLLGGHDFMVDPDNGVALAVKDFLKHKNIENINLFSTTWLTTKP